MIKPLFQKPKPLKKTLFLKIRVDGLLLLNLKLQQRGNQPTIKQKKNITKNFFKNCISVSFQRQAGSDTREGVKENSVELSRTEQQS